MKTRATKTRPDLPRRSLPAKAGLPRRSSPTKAGRNSKTPKLRNPKTSHTKPLPRKRKASSADVLAQGEERKTVPRKWAEHYKHLLELRDHLTRERQTLMSSASEESPQFGLHMADAGTDSYDRDFALGMLSNEQDSLYEIEQALDRIRAGTYGICEMTGKSIPEARLTAIPWTRFSTQAEKQLEERGEIGRAHIGRRETVARNTAENQFGEEQED